MSLQTDAETIRDLVDRITRFEIAKAQATKQGAVVVVASILITQTDGSSVLFDCSEAGLVPTGAQKTALFAAEASWQAQVKALSGAW